MHTTIVSQAEIKHCLYDSALQRRWEEVIEIYKSFPWTHNIIITNSGNTALHLAVLDFKTDVVRQLVREITDHDTHALTIENDSGNTPLHLAASRGSSKMYQYIAQAIPVKVSSRNKDGETPLFLAALHGQKDVFLYLHSTCLVKDTANCRRNDGDTVLHVAINREHFELAFHIILLYKDLVNSVNAMGATPLHVLASKPSAFRSGTHFSWWKAIIYHYPLLFVPTIQLQPWKTDNTEIQVSYPVPRNYGSCFELFKVLQKILQVLVPLRAGADPENPPAGPEHKKFPKNYSTCVEFFSSLYVLILGLTGFGLTSIRQIKEKHKWAVKVMEELLKESSMYSYLGNGDRPIYSTLDHGDEEEEETTLFSVKPQLPLPPDTETGGDDCPANADRGAPSITRRETAILVAAKNGVVEMVEKILDRFPVAIHDIVADNKNMLLVAVENRQPRVLETLIKRDLLHNLIQAVDTKGNTVLHFAARLSEYKPWRIPGAAMQMQWEIKWYEYVKGMVPQHFIFQTNKEDRTPAAIFAEDHQLLVKEGGEWLKSTSESCSVVAALIATVAFATSTTIPGGTSDATGRPNFEDQPAFSLFSITSLVALCFSVTALVMFLAILTSRHQPKDFHRDLPMKLLIGLSSLFVSIASILVSFCAGHFFELKDKLKNAAFPIYAVTCLPVTFYAVAQFPLYFDLVRANFRSVPQPSRKLLDM